MTQIHFNQIIKNMVKQMQKWFAKVKNWILRKRKRHEENNDYNPETELDRMFDEFLTNKEKKVGRWVEFEERKKKGRKMDKTYTSSELAKEKQMSIHRYHIIKGDLFLKLDSSSNAVCNNSWIKTTTNSSLSYLTVGDKAVVMAKINLFSKRLTLIPTHALTGMDLQNLSTYYMLNPMVHSTVKVYKMIEVPVFEEKQKVTIATIDVNLHDYYIITTEILQPINTILAYKGKYKKATIGCIIHVDKQHDAIWSGSLVNARNGMLIISSVTEKQNGLLILVAWTIAAHDIHAYIQ